MQIAPILMTDHAYPFGSCQTSNPIVLDVVFFPNQTQAAQAKTQALKKSSLLANSWIVQLLGVDQVDNSLHYRYQYVPHSINTYLLMLKRTISPSQWKKSSPTIARKISSQLTVLLSELSKMRIQVDLSMNVLGMSHSHILKIYLNPKTKIGCKSEISLILTYSKAKDKIIKEIHEILQSVDDTYAQTQSKRPQHFRSSCHYQPSQHSILKKAKVQQKKQKEPLKRKMSSGNFDLNSKFDTQSQYRKSKPHKYSFQDGRGSFINENRDLRDFYDRGENSNSPQQRQDNMATAKTIKIELQQRPNHDKRKRKDSYKVKITTYREYDIQDCNPAEIFGKKGGEQNIFDFFAQKTQKSRKSSRYQQQEQQQMTQNNDQGQTIFNRQDEPIKIRKQTAQTRFSAGSGSGHQHTGLVGARCNSQTYLSIQQRVREAKERTSRVLGLVKYMKK